jgi:hypothetical protein
MQWKRNRNRNRKTITGRTPRKPLPLGMGRNRGYTRRWFSTYCLTTSSVAPPTVATK